MLAMSGCSGTFYGNSKVYQPAGSYYLNPNKKPSSIGSVAIFEFENKSDHPTISSDMTKEFYTRMQKSAGFGTFFIDQKDPAWTSYRLDTYGRYSVDELREISKALRCQAVLIGTITEYQPYPHMTMGIRLKMVDLFDGQLLWAYENSWDCSDKQTQDEMLYYFKNTTRFGDSEVQKKLITISPLNFIKFIAHEASYTITERGNS